MASAGIIKTFTFNNRTPEKGDSIALCYKYNGNSKVNISVLCIVFSGDQWTIDGGETALSAITTGKTTVANFRFSSPGATYISSKAIYLNNPLR